jgi:cytochrome oxidase Cu insertion factor (SCO1/SenC/PrrC family)
MGRSQKILTVTLWGMLVLAMVAVIGAGVLEKVRPASKPADPLPVLYAAPSFTLTDQNGQPFRDKQLAGHVWIADFIFTQCAGPCPQMTMEMSRLQKSIPDKSVRLVTITADPAHDTPAVLKEYGRLRGADESRWTFLTSARAADIYAVANGLKLSALPADANNPIIHASQFLLVDAQNRVRGIYHVNDPASMARLAGDAAALANPAAAD